MKISVVIPALNEEKTIGQIVKRVPVKSIAAMGYECEVIVVDNRSEDTTREEAIKAGAKVVSEKNRGYGNAYLTGFKEAGGDIIVMLDADGTYPPESIPEFIERLSKGDADLVMGSRLKGTIHKGAMPWLHRYVGNPLLTSILNLLFKTGISDAHCGMRAFKRDMLEKINLRTSGMEFASEMVIEASLNNLAIDEIPIEYYPRTGGEAKLNTFRDGWRHLRFMMLYKPLPFLFFPGLINFLLGVSILTYLFVQGEVHRMHSFLFGGIITIIGFYTLTNGIFLKAYAISYGIGRKGRFSKLLSYHHLEIELLLGFLFIATGVILGLYVVNQWVSNGFGSLSELRTAMISLLSTSIGLQIIFITLFISLLTLNRINK